MPKSKFLPLVACSLLTLPLALNQAAADEAAKPAAGDKDAGAQIFASNGCGWCHENGGRTAGKGPQLMDTSRNDSFIQFRIKHGKEMKMPAFGGSLSDAQIADLIAYIRSLKN